MELLLVKYGYFLLFVGVAVEGEGFLLAAAFLAHRGYLHLPYVMLVALASNCIADQIYYMIARTRGRSWIEERFGTHPSYNRVMDRMSRHANWLLLFSRYAFGFRIIIPAACGVVGMPGLRFVAINLIAGAIWTLPTALVGYYFGYAAQMLFDRIRNYEWWVLLAILAVAIAIVIIRHLRRTELTDYVHLSDLHYLVPLLMGFMGAVNLLSAILPRSGASVLFVQQWLPFEVTQRSRPLMLFAGLALLQVTRGLARRKELAWYVAVSSLSVSLLLHITRALDFHHSLVAGLLLVYLIYFRRRYYARSDFPSANRALMAIPILAFLVFIYGFIGLNELQSQFTWYPGSNAVNEAFRSGILIQAPNLDPNTPHAARFLGSLQIAGWLARLYLLVLLLRPVILRDRREAPEGEIDRIFRQHGNQSLAAFAVQGDKHHALVAERRAMVAYAVRGSVAFACGDPLAAPGDLEMAVKAYLDLCRKNSWTPCIYEASETHLSVYQGLDLKSLKIAEEALLDLKEFSLAGGKRANLRATVNKAAKSGLTVRRYDRKENPDANLDEQLEAISQEWLTDKRLSEMGFTMGRFSLEAIENLAIFVGLVEGKATAFCSWLPYKNGKACVLDLMRKRKDAPYGTMDFLLVHSLLKFQADGLEEASLANAPMANVVGPRHPLERGVALLFENMNSFYGYKNLFFFKKKFAPRWEGRYLIYPKGTDLPHVAYTLTGLHTSTGLLQLLIRR